ncbi:hypothetical protein [Streptomyces sp. NPDC008121]|uniref:hypothetical protein n=1 Tax=Streptomyces sp. NPDC008121 TaxID=3364809 RepID=UPI0036E8CC60
MQHYEGLTALLAEDLPPATAAGLSSATAQLAQVLDTLAVHCAYEPPVLQGGERA